MKFRKKPVIVDAIQFTGDNVLDVANFCQELLPEDPAMRSLFYFQDANRFVINTLEGDMEVMPGAWVIKGIKGEFYPCKPDIFEQTYEPVE